MKPGQFIVNHVNSQELKAVIQNRPVVNVPERNTNPLTVPSLTGSLFMDDGTYANSPLNLNIALYGDTFEEADYNRERLVYLFNSGDYVPFRYYVAPHKLHMVHMEYVTFTSSRRLRYHQEGVIRLSVHPYKYTHDGLTLTIQSSGATVHNPNFYPSDPIIRVEGQGDITLHVNGQPFVMKDVSNYIILNSVVEHAYQEAGTIKVNQDHKINTLDYPELQPGANTISWTGNVSKVIIEPRWQTLT